MPIRKCLQIKKATSKYYGGSYAPEDLALRAALPAVQGLPPCLGRFIGEVWVIADWGSIPFFPFADRLSMAREIENCWSLLDTMRSHSAASWATQTTILSGFVDDLEKKAHLLPTPGTKRRQLSFLSKFLHFCINDAFPIWDSNARAALGHKNGDTTWPSYKTWLIKVRQEADDHSACCLVGLRQSNDSLVRTLDKALFTIGQRVELRLAQLRERS
jgi:hypothetical protein